jgi:hypothetical protein
MVKKNKKEPRAGVNRGIHYVTGDQLDAEDAQKNKLEQLDFVNRGEIEKQRLSNTGQANVANIHNTGQMDVTRENNTGQLARQNLAQSFEGENNVRDYNLDLYKTQVTENIGRFDSQTKRMEANSKINQPQKGVLGDQLTAATAILSDMNSSDEDKKMAREFVFGSFKQPVTTAQPAGERRSIPPPDASKKSSYFTNDTPVQTPARGANTMEFISEDVLKKRKLAERNKKVEEDMFGKPKRSSFLPW